MDSIHQQLILKEVGAQRVQGLRTRVLRPNFGPAEVCEFEQDLWDKTAHFALLDAAGEAVAVATYFPKQCPKTAETGELSARPALQLRGMCVAPGLQGRGLGARLLDGAQTALALRFPEIELIWCNARLSAAPFYKKQGFQAVGEVFEVPEIGPHQVMWRALSAVIA